MSQKPTISRHWVLLVVCLVYFITYIDRINISVAAPMISKEMDISKVQLGSIFASFSLGYFLFMIPSGMLGDRFGARKVLAALVTVWSVLTAMTALMWSFTSLVVCRFFFGGAESGAFPVATRAFSSWIPATARGFAQGITHAFSRVGAAITPPVAVYIMTLWGWKPVFFVFALVGIVWAAFWYFWYRNTPAEFNERWPGSVNQAEMDIISGGKAKVKAPKLPFRQLMKSKNMWAVCAMYFCYSYTLWIYLNWLPTYLVDARGFTIVKMGIAASLPLLAGTIGDTLGGWLSDLIWKRTGNGKMARRSVGIFGFSVAAAGLVPGAMTDSANLAVGLLALALFGLEMSVGVSWAVCLDVGHEYAGTVSASMNSVGNVGSFISPIAFGAIVQYTGSWVYPFLVASALLVIGCGLWMRIDPTRSIIDELDLHGTGINDAPKV